MLTNYIKIAFRNLLKRKEYTIINILSLALGLTGGIFILIYALDELSFDKFHEKADRIYRVGTLFHDPKSGGDGYNSTNAWPIGKILETEFPEVEAVVYSRSGQFLHVNKDESRFTERAHFAGEDMFNIFSFKMLQGNPQLALKEPYSVVITKAMEEKYFPGGSALNQTLLMADSIQMMVKGVIETVPENSHLQFDILVSFSTWEAMNESFSYQEGWGNINLRNYLLLKEGVDHQAFQAKARSIYMDRVGEMMKSWGTEAYVFFEPLKEIYLKTEAGNGMGPLGSMERLNLVLGVCIFTILLACINFINLSTARSVDRAKEVGLRKAVGSSRNALIGQFLIEALALTVMAFLFALLLTRLMLPLFNDLLNKSYEMSILFKPTVVLGILLLVGLISLLSGYYPAIALSAMKPVNVLKGKYIAAKGGINLRKGLVVFQFFISVSLVLGTFMVLDQLRFMQGKDLGFAKEELLVLNASRVPKNLIDAFKYEASTLPGVQSISFSNGIPGRPGWIGQIAYPDGKEDENPVSVEYLAVDEHYVETLGLEVIAGRNFDPHRESDMSEGLVLNERAVTRFGWASPEEAIGQRIVSPSTTPQGVVIGVVKDFHQLGLQRAIHGIVMDAAPQYSSWLVFRFNPEHTKSLIDGLGSEWLQFFSGYDFNYFFLNDDFARLYQSEVRMSKMFTLFAGITILISIIGLLGLVSFMIESRAKELSMRKVLGANSRIIVGLLSKEFVILVLIACIIAIPVVWHFGNQWLENFAYKAPLNVLSFGLAILIAMLITMLTVGFKAFRASTANPINALNSN
jgi:putative ABC transport system permease protein